MRRLEIKVKNNLIRETLIIDCRKNNLRTTLLVTLAITLLTFAAYIPVRWNGFIACDDPAYILTNPHVTSGLTWRGVRWAFTSLSEANWHPLTWLSLMLDSQLFGLNAAGFHFVSLGIHVVASILLLLALQGMTQRPWPSAFVAAVFALHPLHVESVAWAAERKDVLCGMFWALTLCCYGYYVRRGNLASYLAVALSLVLALLSKPMAVTLPLVLLLLDYWPLERVRMRSRKDAANDATKIPKRSIRFLLLEKAPLISLSCASCVLTFVAQQRGGAVISTDRLSLATRFANALISYLRYAGKAFWPVNLSPFYPAPALAWPTDLVLVAALILLGITLACLFYARRFPFLIVGWLWYLGTLVPVIGIVQVGTQVMADRYMYLPIIGLSIMVAWGTAQWAQRWMLGRWVALVGGCAIGACVILTFRQVRFWKDSITLFEHALQVTDDNPFARMTLAGEYGSRGQFQEAIEQYRHAIALQPNYLPAVTAMGRAYLLLGDSAQAEKCFDDAAHINPADATNNANRGDCAFALGQFERAQGYYLESLKQDADQPQVKYNLAMTFCQLAKLDRAEPLLRELLAVDPRSAQEQYQLGWLLAKKGNLDEAEQHLNESLRLRHDAPQVLYELGMLELRRRRLTPAIASLREASRIDPHFLPAIQNLAWILSTHPSPASGDAAEGLQFALRARELDHQDPAVLDTLAAAYAVNGKFQEAQATASSALELAQATRNRPLADEIERHLDFYRKGKPFNDLSLP